MKKRSLLSVLLLTLVALFAFSSVACDKEIQTLKSLQNEYGIVVDGGGFEEGSSLISNSISTTAEEAIAVLTAIAEENAASTEQTSASVTEVGAIVNDIAGNAQKMKEVADKLDASMEVFRL